MVGLFREMASEPSAQGRRRIGWILVLAFLLAACSSGGDDQAASNQVAPIEQFVVRLVPTPEMKDVSGEITTVDQAEIRARIAGVLESLTVRKGDVVRKGQIIGRIVDSRLGYDSSAIGAQAAAAAAQAANARADFERARFLYQNGVYAKAHLDQKQAATRAADAQVAAAHAQQSSVNAVATQGVVVAPASGRVLRAEIPVGSAVMPGTSIATITAGRPVLRIEVPESLAERLRVGALVVTHGLGGTENRGTIVKVYPAVTAGRMTADAEIGELDTRFVGRRLTATIEIGERRAMIVPAHLVTNRYGIDYVTLFEKNGTSSIVPVQVTPIAEADKVEILSGISPGDVLVVAGEPK